MALNTRKECNHETLYFASGDYYIFCRQCPGKWVAHNMFQQEYGFDKHGMRIGADPSNCNPNLSGQERIKLSIQEQNERNSMIPKDAEIKVLGWPKL